MKYLQSTCQHSLGMTGLTNMVAQLPVGPLLSTAESAAVDSRHRFRCSTDRKCIVPNPGASPECFFLGKIFGQDITICKGNSTFNDNEPQTTTNSKKNNNNDKDGDNNKNNNTYDNNDKKTTATATTTTTTTTAATPTTTTSNNNNNNNKNKNNPYNSLILLSLKYWVPLLMFFWVKLLSVPFSGQTY